jgi:hypothetical protein
VIHFHYLIFINFKLFSILKFFLERQSLMFQQSLLSLLATKKEYGEALDYYTQLFVNQALNVCFFFLHLFAVMNNDYFLAPFNIIF